MVVTVSMRVIVSVGIDDDHILIVSSLVNNDHISVVVTVRVGMGVGVTMIMSIRVYDDDIVIVSALINNDIIITMSVAVAVVVLVRVGMTMTVLMPIGINHENIMIVSTLVDDHDITPSVILTMIMLVAVAVTVTVVVSIAINHHNLIIIIVSTSIVIVDMDVVVNVITRSRLGDESMWSATDDAIRSSVSIIIITNVDDSITVPSFLDGRPGIEVKQGSMRFAVSFDAIQIEVDQLSKSARLSDRTAVFKRGTYVVVLTSRSSIQVNELSVSPAVALDTVDIGTDELRYVSQRKHALKVRIQTHIFLLLGGLLGNVEWPLRLVILVGSGGLPRLV